MKEGVLVKVKSYFVFFLYVEVLVEFGIFYREFEYEIWEDLFVVEKVNVLEMVIGVNGSLREVVD